MLQRGMEEAAVLKEEANQKIKLAKAVASQSQLDTKETILAECSYLSARINAITQQHKATLNRNWDDALAIQSCIKVPHKIDMTQIWTKYESKIDNLLEIMDKKAEEVYELKASLKDVRKSAAEEKIELKEKHCQEKLKLWSQKKELQNSIAMKVQEKKEAVTTLKCSHGKTVIRLEMEKKVLNKTACATSKVVTAKDKLATSWLAKLNSSTIVTKKL